MRTVDPILHAALQAGTGQPIVKAYVGYANGTVKNSHTTVWAYKLAGTTLEFWIPSTTNFGSDQEQIWLERGLTIAGVDYTLTTGRFWIWEEEYLPNSVTRFKGGLVPHEYYSDAGDDSYDNVITTFFAAFGKTVSYKDDAEAWLAYQFLPAGRQILMNSADRFLNMLRQKRLIGACDNGGEDVRLYSADVLGASVATLDFPDDFKLFTTRQRSRQFIWRDEIQATHQEGAVTDPIHNLGYLESTASAPARKSSTFEFVGYLRPDLRLQDGDTIKAAVYGATKSATFFGLFTEEWEHGPGKPPAWRLKVEADPVFHSTEGGALPSTIERVSNYTPLNTSTFDAVLPSTANNLQAAMEILDEHHPGGYIREVLGAARTYYVRKEVGACTISNASPAIVTINDHGLKDDDPIVFRTTGSLPTGLTVGVVYYVNYRGTDSFYVAATPDGANLNTSSAGAGTHYVATGNDSHDGSAADRAHAFLTIQHAAEIAASLDSSIYNVTLQLADSHYLELPSVSPALGAGSVTVKGNAAAPTNVHIDGGFNVAPGLTNWIFEGLYFNIGTGSSSYALRADGSSASMKTCNFGTGYTYHLAAVNQGVIFIIGDYTVSAGANYHCYAYAQGSIRVNGSGFTCTITGTPAFSSYAVRATELGYLRFSTAALTFSGAATGTRYRADLNSVIQSNGAGANYFPGNAAGSTATGGQYA